MRPIPVTTMRRPGTAVLFPPVLLALLLLAPVLLTLVPPPTARADPAELPAIPVAAYGWPLAGTGPAGPTDGAGPVARRFLPPPTPYGRGHRGVDLVGRPGTPVVAAGAGTVAQAGVLAGRGVVSVVHPGGLRTTYEPVDPAVVVGARVARGTVVGTLVAGHGGCPAAACLHWGLRWRDPGEAAGSRERYLDPLLLVGLGRTRLLPTG